MKKVLGILIVVLIIFFFWHKEEPTNQTYKIGFVGALTGEGAVYGEPLKNVAQIAVDAINAQGGINGKPVVLIAEDGNCTGEGGASAVSKLIHIDKVQVIIGGICSNESLSAIPIAESAGVALLSPSSNSLDLTGKSPIFFRNYPTVTEVGKVLVKKVRSAGKSKIGFIQEQDEFTLSVFNAFNNEFSKQNEGSIIREDFPPGTTDFKTHLLNLKNQDPEVIFINPLNPGTGDIILSQMRTMGWKPQIIVSDPIAGDSKILESNKDMLEGAWTTEFSIDLNNPKLQNLMNEYKKKYNEDVPYLSFAQTTYDAVFLIRDAIQEVGYDGKKIALWGHNINDWQGASGLITIGADGDRVGGVEIREISEGKLK